jgi:F-type H+-transporting ATPase subunit beta
MDSTDGLSRGYEVGTEEFNQIGVECFTDVFLTCRRCNRWFRKHQNSENGMSIHRQAPRFEDLSTSSEVLFTGIKVIDLIEPYSKEVKLDCLVEPVLVKQY